MEWLVSVVELCIGVGCAVLAIGFFHLVRYYLQMRHRDAVIHAASPA
jgi:hypothetical protein